MRKISEESGRQAVGLALRIGSWSSTLVMAAGLILLLARHAPLINPEFHRLRIGLLLSLIFHLKPIAFVRLGILLLLFTPLSRIVTTLLTFALERDYRYVWVAAGVLAVVLLSISFAIAG